MTTFIDWNSQIHSAKCLSRAPSDAAQVTLKWFCRRLGTALSEIDSASLFDVTLRVYHGWHRGFEPTVNRKALLKVSAGTDFLALSERKNVSIRPDIAYGDYLASASPKRVHSRLGIHLPNTLRKALKGSGDEEKLVDTALACDVVDSAYRDPSRWLVIAADDDDLIPALLTAEAALAGQIGKVFLLRKRNGGPFYEIEDLRIDK